MSAPAPDGPDPAGAPTTHLVTGTGRSGDTLALTFDDGPHPVTTPALLDVLRRHDVRAVFCLCTTVVATAAGPSRRSST